MPWHPSTTAADRKMQAERDKAVTAWALAGRDLDAALAAEA